jgi:hypothetical protein
MARKRKATGLDDLVRLGTLAPRVVAQRVGRLAAATPASRRSDAAEWQRMASEKFFALQESWLGAARAMYSLQQQAFGSAMRGAPWNGFGALAWWHQRWVDAGDVGAAALAPVAKRVAANASRLARKR